MEEKELNEEVVEETVEEETETTEEVKQENVEVLEEKTVPQEEENVIVERELGISEKTYIEFFQMNAGLAKSLRSTAFLCVAMCLILYLFRGEEPNWAQLGLQAGIYCGVIIVVTLLTALLTRYVVTPKQYKKNKIGELRIKFAFSNLGIRQTIDEQTVLVHWSSFIKGVETNNSFFFVGMNRRGLLFSKEGLLEDEITQIRSLCEFNLQNQFKDKRK